LLALPISHKTQALTFQRFILLVLPLLKILEKRIPKDQAKNYDDLKRLTLAYCSLIEDSAYPLTIRVNGVLHIFSIFNETSSLKGVVFQRLFQLCEKNDQIKIIVENLKKIEEISKEWAMSNDERKELYKQCAITLDRNDEQ
jgi:hypothetical protein